MWKGARRVKAARPAWNRVESFPANLRLGVDSDRFPEPHREWETAPALVRRRAPAEGVARERRLLRRYWVGTHVPRRFLERPIPGRVRRARRFARDCLKSMRSARYCLESMRSARDCLESMRSARDCLESRRSARDCLESMQSAVERVDSADRYLPACEPASTDLAAPADRGERARPDRSIFGSRSWCSKSIVVFHRGLNRERAGKDRHIFVTVPHFEIVIVVYVVPTTDCVVPIVGTPLPSCGAALRGKRPRPVGDSSRPRKSSDRERSDFEPR